MQRIAVQDREAEKKQWEDRKEIDWIREEIRNLHEYFYRLCKETGDLERKLTEMPCTAGKSRMEAGCIFPIYEPAAASQENWREKERGIYIGKDGKEAEKELRNWEYEMIIQWVKARLKPKKGDSTFQKQETWYGREE